MSTSLHEELLKWPFAVAGGLVMAAVGFLVWELQQRRAKRYRAELLREAAYKEVWTALMDAEVTIRGSVRDGNLQGNESAVRNANAVLMKHEYALAHDDREVANEFLEATERLARHIREEGSEYLKSRFYTTVPMRRSAGDPFTLFVSARLSFYQRVTAVLGTEAAKRGNEWW